MLLSRILGGIGRFCISLGVLTLLFVAYQLWGTGILTAQAQNDLENDFETLLAEAEVLALPSTTVTAEVTEPESADEPGEVVSAADAAEAEAAAAERAAEEAAAARVAEAEIELLANLLWQPVGDPVARLTIPDIGLEWTVVEGVGTDPLRNGPGHYPSTPLPGMPGNASIAGHRTTWGAPFNRIDELQPGATINVQTLQGVFEYRVIEQESGKGHFIVSPDRVDVLDQDFVGSPNRLTLTACHPKFSARQRIIVVAELVGEPAQFIPRPESLGGPVEASLASEDFSEDGSTEGGDDTTEDGTALPGDPDLIDPQNEGAENEGTDGSTDGDAEAGDPGAEGDVEAVAAPPPSDDESPESPIQTGLQGTGVADDFGEGLNGDRSAILPAIMWGLAATAIAATAGFAARRWRKLPSYAMGLVPFALVLFVCFVHIDQALPSY